MADVAVRQAWDAAIEMMQQHASMLIIGHQRPDGDAIGAMVGLGMGLQTLGKEVTLAVDGGTPDHLQFLPMSKQVLATLAVIDAELVIFVDSSDADITGEVGTLARDAGVPVLVIDHHVTNEGYGDVNLIVEDAVSTTDIVTQLFDKMGITITREMATPLLYGMLGDTRMFQYGPISGATFARVQTLVDAGANINDLSYHMRETSPSGVIILYGLALSRMNVDDEIAWTYLELADFEAVDIEATNVIRCADTMLAAEDVVLAVEVAETQEGNVRMSLRAEGDYQVGYIAEELGGGGHPKAGGATLYDTDAHSALARILPLLRREHTQRHTQGDNT